MVGTKNGSGVWQRIISEMPPHDVYVEAFAGSGVIGIKKKPSLTQIFIDIDPNADIFKRLDIEKRLQVCTSLSGYLMHEYSNVRPYHKVIHVCGDAIYEIRQCMRYFDNRWLFYFDPPYLGSTRSCKRKYYTYEFDSEERHRTLLLLAKELSAIGCMVMISGYYSELYDQFLKNWRVVFIDTVDRRGKKRIESLWMNFREPFQFHDTRFLGKNFRERERIKKKKNRWIKRLKSMNRLDRGSILDAIDDVRSYNDEILIQ
jgi:site-specific DNA-adenine methylase